MSRIIVHTRRVLSLAFLTLVFLPPAQATPISNDIDIAINHLLSIQQIQRPNSHDSWDLGFDSQFFQQATPILNNPYSPNNPNLLGKETNGRTTIATSKNALSSLSMSPPAIAALHASNSALSSSSKRCALYVRRALNKAGYTNFTPQPSAYMYESVMPNIGFSKISASNYTPAVGDVIVWRRKQGNPHGHIQIYNGEQWVSDFKQPSMYIYGQNHNGYTIWRDLNHVKATANNGVHLALNN